MAKKKVQGIVIDIGGDTTKLTKSLSEVNKEINSTQRELKEVEKRLKIDPGNTELLKQKQELLNKSIEATDEKLKALKIAKGRADTAMANGTEVNEKMLRKLQREIFDAENSVESLTDEVKNLDNASNKASGGVSKLGKSTDNMNGGFTLGKALIKDFIVDGVEFLITKTAELISETREYREDMNKLNAAFISAEHTTDAAKKTYNEFYKLLGESDRSVEAVNHLAQFVKEEKDLIKWGNIAAGVNAAFTDSLPIEGLTEAANETAKVSKVTGVLADAINWISKDSNVFKNALGDNKKALAAFNKTLKDGEPLEDAFSAALAEMSTEQERAKFITDTLNEAYSEEAEAYKEMNADIMASREATEKLMEAKAAFAAKLEPIMTGAKNIVADFALNVAESWGLIQSENDKLVEKVNKIGDSYSAYRESVKQNAVEELAQVERYKTLYNELQNLVDQSGAVQEVDKTRAEYIIGELNEALGLEIEMNGNVIDSLDSYSGKIDEIIAKKQAQILLESQEALYAEALEKITAAEAAQTEANDKLIEKKQTLLNLEEKLATASQSEAINITKTMSQIRGEIEGLEKTYNEASDTVEQYSIDMKTYEDATAAAVEGNVNKIIEILDGENEARKESADLTGKTEKEKQEITGQQLIEAVRQYELAAENLEKVDCERNRQALERAEAHATEMAEAYKAVGGQIVDGQVVGMDGKKVTLFNKAEELVKGLKDKFTGWKGFWINSPSKWAKKMMEWVDIGLAEGIEENTSAEEAMEKKVKNLKNKISDIKGEADIDSDISDAEFELWKLANPDATEDEVFTRETGKLMTAIKNQSEKIDLVNVSYEEMKKLTGENSEESKSLQLELINERIELEKLNDEMAELIENRKKLNEASTEGNGGQKSVSVEPQTVADYYKYIAKYGGDLAKQGLSNEDIQKAATSMTGYTAPSYNSENNSNVVNKNIVINQTINSPKPLSQYEVKKGTQKAIKQAEIEGGLM